MLQVVVAHSPFAVLLARLTVPFSPAAFGTGAEVTGFSFY